MTTHLGGGYTLAPDKVWTDRAATWPIELKIEQTEAGHWHTDVVHAPRLAGQPVQQAHLACCACGQSVQILNSELEAGPGYRVMVGDILSGVVAHLRRSHDDHVSSPVSP